MKSSILAVSAVAFLVSGVTLTAPAFAETQEEAAAYVFLGLADGAALTRGPVQLTWKKVSSSPAVFQGHGEGGGKNYDVTFTVKAAGDCDYEIKLSGAPNMVRDGEALYANVAVKDVTSVVPNADALHLDIEGNGFCQTGTLNPNCVPVHQVDVYGAVNAATHAAMFEQIRAPACVKP